METNKKTCYYVVSSIGRVIRDGCEVNLPALRLGAFESRDNAEKALVEAFRAGYRAATILAEYC